MKPLLPFIYLAGALQLLIASANFFLPAKIDLQANLEKCSRFIRQIFHVHTAYLVLISIFYSALCFLFPNELAGGSPLGRFTSGFISFYWLLRLTIQIFYYDSQIKRKFLLAHAFFSMIFLYLGVVFGIAAIGRFTW